MTRLLRDRRINQILVLTECRRYSQKEAAAKMGMTWNSLRQILYRWRHSDKRNSFVTDLNNKVA